MVTYDQAAKQVKIYINGALDNTVTLITAPSANLTASTIGAWSNDTDRSRYFNGKLDEMRIWNTTRTANDISGNMYKQITANKNGLLAYYNFNSKAGVTLRDFSGNANDGTLTNFALTGNSSNWVESFAMGVPVPQSATEITSNAFTLNWEKPDIGTVDKYIIQLSANDAFDPILNTIDAGTMLSKNITGLSENTQYFYRIQAKRPEVIGEGAYSPMRSVTTLTGVPIGGDKIKTSTLSLYPNPATNGFIIEAEDTLATLTIHTLAGSLVKTQTVSGKTYVDVSSLKAGAYLVRLNSRVVKLVKR